MYEFHTLNQMGIYLLNKALIFYWERLNAYRSNRRVAYGLHVSLLNALRNTVSTNMPFLVTSDEQ